MIISTVEDEFQRPSARPVKNLPFSLAKSVGLGESLFFFYVMAAVREYLWPVKWNVLAWFVASLLTVIIWGLYVVRRRYPERDEEASLRFLLIVALPLFVFYAIRVAFPDTSYDVLNYRLNVSEEALRGFPSFNGNFLRNPLPDMITGVFRHCLGYRLGTLMNYLVVLWIAAILNKMLRPYVRIAWHRYMAVLIIVLTENVLFEMNTYMTDLLAVPLLLEATYVSLGTDRQMLGSNSVYLSMLLGMSVALKLSNVAFVIPIILVYTYRIFRKEIRLSWRRLLESSACFLAPLLPFTLYVSWQTRNPIYPFFNRVFNSPYVPPRNITDLRWGPRGLLETVFWPILVFFEPGRVSEAHRYSGRISLGFLVAVVCLVGFKLLDGSARFLVFILISGSIAWSYAAGYIRYGLFLEVLSGLLLFTILFQFSAKRSGAPYLLNTTLSSLVLCILAAQSIVASSFAYSFDWGERPTGFDKLTAFKSESRNVFRDYSLQEFLSPACRDLINGAEVWIESGPRTSGIETLLKRDAPLIYLRGYYETDQSSKAFSSLLAESARRKMMSLCFVEDLKTSTENIISRGLTIGKIIPIEVPFYSKFTVLKMVLVEVWPPGREGIDVSITSISTPLPESGYHAEISVEDVPARIKAGSSETIYVKVRNLSDATWPATAQDRAIYQLRLGNHWLDENRRLIVNDDGRASLLYDLKPRSEAILPLTVAAPAKPGNYLLEIDMVQEGVTWFAGRGSKTWAAALNVE